MQHLVIGTAGHVDHGKTTLIKALTGAETDRLPEEKKRGISIDLGFARFDLPSGRSASVVDVPGHERFIKNMVAGVSGMDLVLLVVAADEGVMPQTREHLDILQLLGVERGLVALTKIDMVDEDWLDLVKEELAESLAGTFLAGTPILPVSGVTGEGVEELKARLDAMLPEVKGRDVAGFPRLAVDRVFTVAGFGTVVTGTLTNGTLHLEDRLELLPAGRDVRVRGLQVHGESVAEAPAGQRLAVNLAGVDRDEVERGDVLAAPGVLKPTRTFAARLTLLPDTLAPLENGTRIRLHTGTSEILGRVLLLDREELAPGESGYIQFKAERPAVVARLDRFIIRTYSPMHTVGGGQVLDPHRRYKRFNPGAAEELRLKESEDPRDLLRSLFGGGRPVTIDEVVGRAGKPREELAPTVEALVGGGELVQIDAEHLMSATGYRDLEERLQAFFADYRRRLPLRRGVPREELRRALWSELDAKASANLLRRLEESGTVRLAGERVEDTTYEPAPSAEEQEGIKRLRQAFAQRRMNPPAGSEADDLLKGLKVDTGELLHYLAEEGELVKVDDDLFFSAAALEEAREKVRAFLTEQGEATLAELRDLLGTTRKYAVPLAEHFDSTRLTRRVGDKRKLHSP